MALAASAQPQQRQASPPGAQLSPLQTPQAPPRGAAAAAAQAWWAAPAAEQARRTQVRAWPPAAAARAARAWRARHRTAAHTAPARGGCVNAGADHHAQRAAYHEDRALRHPQRGVAGRLFASLRPGGGMHPRGAAGRPDALERVQQKGAKVGELAPRDVAVAVHALVRSGALKEPGELAHVCSRFGSPAVGGARSKQASGVSCNVARRKACERTRRPPGAVAVQSAECVGPAASQAERRNHRRQAGVRSRRVRLPRQETARGEARQRRGKPCGQARINHRDGGRKAKRAAAAGTHPPACTSPKRAANACALRCTAAAGDEDVLGSARTQHLALRAL